MKLPKEYMELKRKIMKLDNVTEVWFTDLQHIAVKGVDSVVIEYPITLPHLASIIVKHFN